MSATITIITSYIESPKQFKGLDFYERRQSSVGWKEFPSRSGRLPGHILIRATQLDLGLFECDPKVDWETGEKVHTAAIDRETLVTKIPLLAAVVESSPEATAHALVATVGNTADRARVLEALSTGTWPDADDAAAEAGAFAYQLLAYSRIAVEITLGIYWEYRGEFPLA